MAIDLQKYQKTSTRKGASGTYPVHYVKFSRDGSTKRDLEDWEVRAYDIVHALMKRENMTIDQVKYMIYAELLSEVGDELGI